MANPFSPNYKEPKKVTPYLKLSDGSNLFRILTPKEEIISYYAEFLVNPDATKKKVFYPDKEEDSTPPTALSKEGVKLYWSMVVFNHDTNCVQIAEFSQQSIKQYIGSIASSRTKGDWSKFDIEILKSGQGIETKYVCESTEKQELSDEAKKICRNQYDKINLKAMETGGDPFDPDYQKPTPTTQPQEDENYDTELPVIDETLMTKAPF